MSQGFYARHESAPGAMLSAAREELNLSVSDVARHLKLSPAQVEALEEGAYDRLPGRVFVRGFLRNYAKLLGIDPQPLLRSIEHEMPQPAIVEEAPQSPEVVMPREQPARWPMQILFAAMAIVGALAIYEFGFNEPRGDAKEGETNTTAAPGAAPAEASPGAAPVAPTVTPSTPPSTGTVAAKATASSTPPPAPATAGPGAAATALPGAPAARGQGELIATAPAADAAQAPAAGQRALQFKFDVESWVEIRDRNDKIIFSKLNRPGSEERVNGVPPLKLVVGNARGVHLNYDDKPVDLSPHIGVTVARLTLQ
jgi:cytoskeleton protein RodZ